MNYNAFKNLLISKKEEKFAAFSAKLSNSNYQTIGVKNPDLRQIVKDYKNDPELNLDEFELGKCVEIDFLYFAFSLSRAKTNIEKLEFIEEKIHYAKSWMITDMVSTYIKKISFNEYWPLFLKLYKSRHVYDRRMAYVLGLKLYRDQKVLQILNYINLNEDYMVMMAEAWLLATLAINFSEEIYVFLEKTSDKKLKLKTISKMVDSFRISEETKTKFKALRK